MHWYWQDVDLDDWTTFSFIFNRVMALDWCRNFVYAQYLQLWTNRWILINFCKCIDIDNVGKDSYNLFFVIFQLSYGPWLMSEFYFHFISWEQIDGFWWKFVYAALWLTHEIFPNFSTELWPLIDVKISISLEIMNGFWYKILFIHWYIYMIHVVTNTHYFPELFNRVMTPDWF